MLPYPTISKQYKKQITAGGKTYWVLFHLPDDYFTSTKKYPLLIYSHGSAEWGTQESDLSKLFNHGPNGMLKDGKKLEFENNGIVEKFIVVAPQMPKDVFVPKAVFEHLVKNMDYSDRVKAVFATGLSLGGRATSYLLFDQKYSDILKLFTSLVIMSPYMSVEEFAWTCEKAKEQNIPVHIILGNKEEEKFNRAADQISKILSGTIVTRRARPNGAARGHCCWSEDYDENYIDPTTGMNIYRWLLSKMPVEVIELPKPSEPIIIGEPEQPTESGEVIVIPAPVLQEYTLNVGDKFHNGRRLIESRTIWKQLAGPTVKLPEESKLFEIKLTGLTPGEYQFQASVTNDTGKKDATGTEVRLFSFTIGTPEPSYKVISNEPGKIVIESKPIISDTTMQIGETVLEIKIKS